MFSPVVDPGICPFLHFSIEQNTKLSRDMERVESRERERRERRERERERERD